MVTDPPLDAAMARGAKVQCMVAAVLEQDTVKQLQREG